MKVRYRGTTALVLAALSLPLGLGCDNRTNESGTESLKVPPNAPKSQAEYIQQSQDLLKSAPKSSRKKSPRTPVRGADHRGVIGPFASTLSLDAGVR